MEATPKLIQGGLLVVFEGIDGVGKTTQLELARDALMAEGWQVHVSRNLGGTPIGEELRKVMLAPIARPSKTNLYISVAILEALVEATELERAKGSIILMDRGPLSLAAYEIYGAGLDESLGWRHVDAGMEQFKPELTIIYNGDVKTALGRIQDKPGKTDYFESKPPDFFERVAHGYDEAAKRYTTGFAKIDAGQPIQSAHEQTMVQIRKILARPA